MFRRLIATVLVFAGAATAAVAQTPSTSHAQMHAMLMSGAPMDSAQCAVVHATLHDHLAQLGFDSTQMAAVHTMLLAHAGATQLDSAQLASIHATLHGAMASGKLDADHVAQLHSFMLGLSGQAPLDSAHAALANAIRACAAGTGEKTVHQR